VDIQHQIKRTLSSPEGLVRLQSILHESGAVHRTALAMQVCSAFGFMNARGQPQRSGCLKALRELERAQHIVLPLPRTAPRTHRPRAVGECIASAVAVPNELSQVRGLQLVLVEDAAQRAIWDALMAHEHPRGAGPGVGCQIRYLLQSQHGWLGAIGFAAAALRLSVRDQWIGWDDAQRRSHLHRVVGLSRLLIRPGVRVAHLASHVLGQVLRRLPEDFERRYGYRPYLVETFVETPTYSGVSLRAANWRYLGDTRGRGRQDRTHACDKTCKAIYVYALQRNWRQQLGVPAAATESFGPGASLAPGEGLDSAHWAAHEFGDAPLGDRRLSRRLVMCAERQAEDPMRAFTGVAKTDWAAAKGYYRLIDQPADSEVSAERILQPHRQRTLRRMQAQPTVLCIQDGTDLNFATRPDTTGLGVIGRNQTAAVVRGLHLHSTFAVSSEGLPLGVLRAEFSGEVGPDKKTERWLNGLRDCAAAARELPHTRLVSVMDREADFFDLFVAQRDHPRVQLLVRALHNRRLDAQYTLFEKVRQSPIQGLASIAVGRQSARLKSSKQQVVDKRLARTAEVALRYVEVQLVSSRAEHKHTAAVRLWVVHAREEQPPAGAKALEWFLLTTLPVDSPEQARQMLSWYCLRWRIEDWHRVLKTGCRIEQLGHHTAERLERAIAIHLVIGWRIMLMTLLGREPSELPPELLFSDLEIKVLTAFAKTTKRLPAPTTLNAAVRIVAGLGGYLARNRDPPPGHQLMWYGYITLQNMCAGYALREQADP